MRIRLKTSTAATLTIIVGCVLILGGFLLLSESVGMGLGFFVLGAVFIWYGVKTKRRLQGK